MMRTSVPRTLWRSCTRFPTTTNSRLVHGVAQSQARNALKQSASASAKPLALTIFRASPTALMRSYATASTAGTVPTGSEQQQELANQSIMTDPDHVNLKSSVHGITSEVGEKEVEEADVDMMAGIRHDMKVIKDTFALDTVPREAINIGLAGVVPYLATSAGTLYCAFEISNAAAHGGLGFLMSERTAELCLHVLEPLQVGYGAVIISFLGAIHWGLEWAKYGGTQGYKRYAIGIVAPAVAWPTILMPVEYALITQFLAFVMLYSVDSSATVRGWVPPWYSSYRFILTFIVGASIVLSLIGRGHVGDRVGKAPSASDHFKELQRETFTKKSKGSRGKDEVDE